MLKKTLVKLVILLMIGVFLTSSQTVMAAAGINRKINFQGRVVNNGASAGTNVTDGNYSFVFSLYSVASAGTSLWSEVWNTGTSQIGITAGTFNVALGTYATFPPSIDFNSDSLYLGIGVSSDAEMTPRIQMAAVPYAFNAEKVGGLTVTNTTGTLTIPSGKTISFGDAFSTTGVGITLNQSLATSNNVTFAGLSIGGSAAITTNFSVGGTFVSVGSTNTVSNLSADYLDGFNSSYFLNIGQTGGFNSLYLSAAGVGLSMAGAANIGTSLTIGTNLRVGGSLTFTGLSIGTGSTILYIDSSGRLVQGTLPPGGSAYTATNGLNLNGSTFGLGGTFTANTNINAANYNLSFLGLGGTQVLFIGGTGGVGIGTTAPEYRAMLEVNSNDSIGVTSNGNLRNSTSILNLNATNYLGYVSALANRVYYNGTGTLTDVKANYSYLFNQNNGNIGTATGLYNYLFNNSSGVITNSYGVYTIIDNYQNGVMTNAIGENIAIVNSSNGGMDSAKGLNLVWSNGVGATIANAYGIYLGAQNGDDNAITNNYGIYIEDQSATASTNSYALFSAGGQSYFAGNVGIGASNTLYALNVGGSGRFGDLRSLGSFSVGGTFISVGSTNLVTNLNANYLNAHPDTYFLDFGDTGPFIQSLTAGVGISLGGTGFGRTIAFDQTAGVTFASLYLSTAGIGLSTAGAVRIGTSLTVVGNISIGGTFLSVGSTNLVTSLNANYLNAHPDTYFLDFGDTGPFIQSLTAGVGISLGGTGFGRTIAFDQTAGVTFASLYLSTAGIGLSTAGAVNIGTSLGIGTNLRVGGSLTLAALPLGTGTTVLYINSLGVLVQGTLPSGGTTYTATNGLNLNGSVFGLGGTLTSTTQIGTSNFGLSFLGINSNTQIMFIGASGVGFGTTNPASRVEINSGIGGTSGLRFTQLTSASTTGTTNNKVLTVDSNGNVFLAADQTGSGSLPTGTTATQTIRFDGSQWSVSNFLFNNETSLGLGTTRQTATLDIAVTGGTGNSYINAGSGKFVVAGSGGVSVSGASVDNIKNTSSTGLLTDFDAIGATLATTGTTAVGNMLGISFTGVINSGLGLISTTTIGTTGAVGLGGQVIIRSDGSDLIILGGGSSFGAVWGGVGNTMTQLTVATGATLPGVGAIALKRQDGKYLLVHGNNSGYTSIFDPFGITAAVAGPPVCGGVTVAAGTGTNAFQRWDGKYVITCGGTTAWGLYDPSVGTGGTFVPGTAVSWAFGAGSHSIMRDDGNFVVFQGGVGNTGFWIYNAGATGAGTMTTTSLGSSPLKVAGAGAFTFRPQGGIYDYVLDGGPTTVWIYDVAYGAYGNTNLTGGAGQGPTEYLGEGAQLLWRPDGKYLLLMGGGSTTTNIIDPGKFGTSQFFTVGPTLPVGVQNGVTAFLSTDGNYYIVQGSGTTGVFKYNMGYSLNGSYESEPINTNGNLNAASSLNWTANTEGTLTFFARTGVGLGVTSATYKPIYNSGTTIGLNSTSDNYIQVKITMKKDLPVFIDQEWGVRKANQTRYRRVNREPNVYSYTVDNSAALRRTQFDFGSDSTQRSTQVNLINNSDKNLGLSLATQANFGNFSPLSNTVVLGSYAAHNPIGVASSQAAIVMRKPNGQFEVAIGAGSATSYVYDQSSQTFTVGTGSSLPTAKLGAGALAFKRPDGKFFIVLGDGSSTTNIYNPATEAYSAGPVTTGNVGPGSMLIMLPNGRVLIVHGGWTTTTSIYDPFTNLMNAGPGMYSTVGPGSLVIPRPDGTFFMAMGTGITYTTNTTTTIFNPYTMSVATTSPAISLTAGRGIGPGSMAIPRSDGNWLVVLGAGSSASTGAAATPAATNVTMLYNPIANKIATGPVLLNNVGYGGHAVPRADGTWLIVSGSGAATTNIYIEKANAYIADVGIGGTFLQGPATVSNINAGAVAFQRDDGKWTTLTGGATTVNLLDALWVDKGIYKSESISIPNLDSNSSLSWQAVPMFGGVTAEVKTGSTPESLSTAASRDIPVSGGSIGAGVGDTYVQISFNFKRTFPSYSGILTDVWSGNAGGQNGVSLRNIITPTLSSFSISKDANLINIKSDGASVFRVSSNGSIYTSNNGVVNSGGADLAENYTSSQELQKGELVSIDNTNNHGVVRTKYQYQPDLVGVVSSDPGFVAGSYTVDSYPIALVGRVPVLVSTENGEIKTGDRLTASSVPGYAMRATKAGRVIGEALESLDMSVTTECPETDFANTGRKCGKIMMFVNLTDYMGMPVEAVMDSTAPTTSFFIDNSNEKILKYLEETKQNANGANLSQLFTDKVVAGEVVADTIVANKIKANSIEGLEIFTDKIGSLSQKYDDLKKQVEASASAVTVTPTVTATPTTGGIKLFGDTEISGNLLLKSLTQFWNKVLFKDEVSFEKAPIFNQDTAGFAVINPDDDRVEIKFDKAFGDTPVVNATILIENDDQKTIFDENYAYYITKRSNEGFTIVLNKKAKTEIKFAWSALAVKDAKTFKAEISPTLSPLSSEILGVSVSGVDLITPTAVLATPSAEASGGATIKSNE